MITICQYSEKMKPFIEKWLGFELTTRDETHRVPGHGEIRFIRTERIPSNATFREVK